jgi:hypothetical protein
MTDEITATPVLETPAPEPVAPQPVPGNAAQTAKAVEFFAQNEEAFNFLLAGVKEKTQGKLDPAAEALSKANRLENELALRDACMKNNIPYDKMHLVKGSNPAEIAAHAAEIGPLVQATAPAPNPAAPVVDTPTADTRPAGATLPAPTPIRYDVSSPKAAEKTLEELSKASVQPLVK